jgi:hypothetical protein
MSILDLAFGAFGRRPCETDERKGVRMVVTKADVYEKMISTDRPLCPQCGAQMKIWECTETGLSCGSGWGTPYLFVCLNDACPPFVNGWESMKSGYGRKCSFRCISFPDSLNTEMMMVCSYGDCQSGLLDEAVIAADRARGTDEDPEVQELQRCLEHKDLTALMDRLFDDKAYYRPRMRAAVWIGELGLVKAIDALRDHRFLDQRVRTVVREAIQKIHAINQTQECPHCAEIIEAQCATCSQCGGALPRTRNKP